MFDKATIEAAASVVYKTMTPTPQICWPLLSERAGCEVWVKHENHTPIGAFKVRGGLTYMRHLKKTAPKVTKVVAATRGNHGQSIALAARNDGYEAVICVPHGNSLEKNAAMRAFGCTLIEHGEDFEESFEHAQSLAQDDTAAMVPSFHESLVAGVSTYGWELFQNAPELDTVYVPIGLGSGICGVMAAREALGLKTEVVGVAAENACTYALSFEAGKAVPTNSANTMADGLACRIPHPEALELILAGVSRIVTVSEAEIQTAMRAYYRDTHNLAEGAGAAALAALLKEKHANTSRRVGVILSGGNIDLERFRAILGDAEQDQES
jgi:threonine dehydratase